MAITNIRSESVPELESTSTPNPAPVFDFDSGVSEPESEFFLNSDHKTLHINIVHDVYRIREAKLI